MERVLIKLWIDDKQQPPAGYDVWLRSVEEAKLCIGVSEDIKKLNKIELIDIDADAGEYTTDGGNYIELLKWLESRHRNYTIKIHSNDNDVVDSMREIIKRNGWKEIV